MKTNLMRRLKREELITPSIVPMSEGATWIWRLYINGKPVDMSNVRHVALKSQFGVINFGADEKLGYNSVAFEETGRGGAIIVPFVCLNGRQVVRPDQPHDSLLVGVIEQYRNKQGGMVLNVPRGFVQEGEEHDETATRELVEETGLQGRPFLLPGHPLNPNSAFFETGADGGCKVYGFCLTADQVEIDITGVVFPITDELPADKTGELIGKCRFIPIAEALRLGDMFSVAGAARLLLFLYFKK